jgi:UDP-N-acetylglucosamine 2-epimerase (non-hydrolysing)
LKQQRILIIFGTRPEAIKMAPLVLAFKKSRHHVKVCVTAQHRQMLDQVLSFFELTPDYDLDLMSPNQTLNSLSGRLFQSIDLVYQDYKPDLVFVHGDTTTSSICAWAAFHRKIKVAHIEAGLRTYNLEAPFPEELNRQITGRIATLHFAPTDLAKQNLLKEGVPSGNIIITGNTVIDALFIGLDKLKKGYINDETKRIKSLIDNNKKLILVTGHRRENFGEGFEQICFALLEISKLPDVQIIYPVHLNPNVQEPVYNILGNQPNIILLDPVGYPTFIFLIKSSYLVITDSGGIQEEAPSLGKPVLVMRETSERPEAIKYGIVKLVGTDKTEIVREASKLLINENYYKSISTPIDIYGDGNACIRIINFINLFKINE